MKTIYPDELMALLENATKVYFDDNEEHVLTGFAYTKEPRFHDKLKLICTSGDGSVITYEYDPNVLEITLVSNIVIIKDPSDNSETRLAMYKMIPYLGG